MKVERVQGCKIMVDVAKVSVDGGVWKGEA
jgi:hypothetical protein